MGDIKFGPGTFYFLGKEGGYIPIGDGNGIIGEITDEPCDMPNEPALLCLTTEASFEMMSRISEAAYMTITGLRNVILNLCPNKQVVHLANHATKKRTRKKNFRRAIRILEV